MGWALFPAILYPPVAGCRNQEAGWGLLHADQLDRAVPPTLPASFEVDGEAGFTLIIIPE